ncbi:MAG: FtsW/RodA/SpoVE family cell cycle protein [Candidatus Paceibacterota bacterium]
MKERLARNLWVLTFILLAYGMGALISSSLTIGQEKFNDPFYFAKKQLLQGILLGLLSAYLFSKINLEILRKLSTIFLLLNICLLLMCFFSPFSYNSDTSAKRWLKMGPLIFQPSELLKITYPLFLSNLLANYSLKKRRKIISKPFLGFLVSLGIIALLILKQPATGTLLVISLSSLIMYFSASMSLGQILIFLGLGGGLIAYIIKKSPYRLSRIFSFLSAEKDPLGSGYQVIQSLTGIGLGGLFGVGFGHSIQKFYYLPQAHTDSIFSIIAEEFGFIGSVLVLILFILLCWFGITISKKVKNKYYKYLALGLSLNITLQAFINIAAMCRLLPITGIPLPFFSYGGSAMVINLTIVGLLINIIKHQY